MKEKSRQMALGGMITALAVVIMSLGSIIPVNTYVCPVLCILLTRPLLSMCGKKIAGCYYIAVSILSLLLAPDREAALVYVFLGYYPLARLWLERIRPKSVRTLLKVLLFTAAGAAVYGLMLFVLGMEELMAEFQEMGVVMTVVMVLFWDVLFLMVDRLLGMKIRRKR